MVPSPWASMTLTGGRRRKEVRMAEQEIELARREPGGGGDLDRNVNSMRQAGRTV